MKYEIQNSGLFGQLKIWPRWLHIPQGDSQLDRVAADHFRQDVRVALVPTPPDAWCSRDPEASMCLRVLLRTLVLCPHMGTFLPGVVSGWSRGSPIY